MLRARGKQPPALPGGRSVGEMPVAIWSESGAADPLLTPAGCAANRSGARHSPSACYVGRGMAFQHWWALLLPDWEWLMPCACASFNCAHLQWEVKKQSSGEYGVELGFGKLLEGCACLSPSLEPPKAALKDCACGCALRNRTLNFGQ